MGVDLHTLKVSTTGAKVGEWSFALSGCPTVRGRWEDREKGLVFFEVDGDGSLPDVPAIIESVIGEIEVHLATLKASLAEVEAREDSPAKSSKIDLLKIDLLKQKIASVEKVIPLVEPARFSLKV